jgi:O-antigen ligase
LLLGQWAKGDSQSGDRGGPWRWAIALVVLAIALAVAGGAGLLPASVTGRLGSIVANLRIFDAASVDVTPENFAVVERMAQLQAGWRMFASRPLLGVGPGNYSNAYGAVAVPPWYDSRGHAHNYYLHMAAEAGALGLLTYLGLLAVAVRQGLRALRRPRGAGWLALALGCCGIIAAAMVHNLFENLHVLYLPLQLGAAWGLLVAAEKAEGKKEVFRL